jgi:hypothetical protein
MTRSHWSVGERDLWIIKDEKIKPTYKGRTLIIEDPLDGDDISLKTV